MGTSIFLNIQLPHWLEDLGRSRIDIRFPLTCDMVHASLDPKLLLGSFSGSAPLGNVGAKFPCGLTTWSPPRHGPAIRQQPYEVSEAIISIADCNYSLHFLSTVSTCNCVVRAFPVSAIFLSPLTVLVSCSRTVFAGIPLPRFERQISTQGYPYFCICL